VIANKGDANLFCEKYANDSRQSAGSGTCRVIELGGSDSSMTIIFSVDQRSFRKIGDIWIWGNHITVQIRRKTIAGVKADRFARQLLDKFCLQMEPWYAHAEDPAEFRAKNILADSTGTRAIGVDFSRSLPGLGWLNYFRPACVDEIGRARFAACPAHEKKELKGGVRLALGFNPSDWQTDDYMHKERAAIAALGREYFFLRHDQQQVTISPFRGHIEPPDGR
jgi:hypothetical protein